MDEDVQKLINEVVDDFFKANKARLDPYPEIQGPITPLKKEEK
jgi:hypothetical protein